VLAFTPPREVSLQGTSLPLSERILVQANVTVVALDRDKENSQAMKDELEKQIRMVTFAHL
jgi:hypothetical protein